MLLSIEEDIVLSHLWRWFVGLHLVSGGLYVTLVVVLFVGLAALLVTHRDRRWSRSPCSPRWCWSAWPSSRWS